MPKVYFASDHAGFDLKEKLVAYVGELGCEVADVGAYTLDTEDDYPDFITPCAQKVAEACRTYHVPHQMSDMICPTYAGAFGIIIGGSGQGEAMCANRVVGIRAAVFYGGASEIVRLAREHNDANILSLGARFVSIEEAKESVHIFLTTPFSDAPRHARRLAKF